MLLIPIRTESPIRRTPRVNIALISLNAIVFMFYNQRLAGQQVKELMDTYLVFDSAEPALFQFFTYPFLHGDFWHLLGNMLFLWVFGNSVNAKMGDVPYLLFYLAGGVLAAWGFAVTQEGGAQLVGASGAIAAVTTAYLALFPRSHVKVLFIFFLITTFDLPAMVIIGIKIIIWDNILAPSIGSTGGGAAVAYSAHLTGYFFGFVAAMGMLLVRALPRDQFDMLALWKRWHQRRQLRMAMANPEAAARAKYGTVARVGPIDEKQRATEDALIDEITDMRAGIQQKLDQGDAGGATGLFERLIARDPDQCLPEQAQLRIAREFYGTGRFSQAAAAFERFISRYAASTEANDVRLLLGIIYARDLRRYEAAEKHLSESVDRLNDKGRRAQCLHWLKEVRAALGR